jgi:hypothetical protein
MSKTCVTKSPHAFACINLGQKPYKNDMLVSLKVTNVIIIMDISIHYSLSLLACCDFLEVRYNIT